MTYDSMTWGPGSESFHVGSRVAPAGTLSALRAIGARLAGDMEAACRNAQQAMDADRYANDERAAGREGRRGNIVGNAWSYFAECLTERPSGW